MLPMADLNLLPISGGEENRGGIDTRYGCLTQAFPDRLQKGALLARYTASRIGGPADALIEAQSSEELESIVSLCWRYDIPFFILGGGSNVLVSDRGVRGLVIINRARQVRFDIQAQPPTVWAESGANFGLIARQAALQGLAGLEWAAGIPGTLGGAVVGNAGAHGGDIAGNLIVAEILQPVQQPPQQPLNDSTRETSRENWSPEQMDFTYRSSLLKRQRDALYRSGALYRTGSAILLSALLRLEQSSPQVVQAKIDEFVAYRRRTQPPGASMGSMFKNPPDDFAGRLIEAAGLKGVRQGDAQISPLHANFFINLGSASAADVAGLIQLARQTVAEKFNQQLELEVQLLGDW